jgi:excisionase family DNA binding protein
MNTATAKVSQNKPENVADRKPPVSVSYPWAPRSQYPTTLLDESPEQWRSSDAKMTAVPYQERLLNAREVAARLGVSERWVRDHTTRRFPKIRGVKLGTLMRYRWADVEEFMEKLTTSRTSPQSRFGV